MTGFQNFVCALFQKVSILILFLYTLWHFNDGALISTQNDADIADNVVKYIFSVVPISFVIYFAGMAIKSADSINAIYIIYS